MCLMGIIRDKIAFVFNAMGEKLPHLKLRSNIILIGINITKNILSPYEKNKAAPKIWKKLRVSRDSHLVLQILKIN